MLATKGRNGFFWAAAAAALAVIGPALLRGEGLLATAALWRVPPWNSFLPPRYGAGLLSDQLLYLEPWRAFMREEFLAGRFPLWNPFILAGVPFAACVQAAPFYPLNAGLLWLPAVPFSLVAAFLKLFAAGAFTGLHLRRLGASPRGSVLGAVVFSLGGFMVVWLGHPHSNTACLLPALFWALGRLSESGSSRDAALLGLFTGLALLGGHPPTMLHVLGASAAYAVFLAERAPRSDRVRFIGLGLLAALLGVGLAAPALLPYLEYHGLSSSAAASGSLARWSTRLSPWLLLHLIMPLASGSPARGAEILAGMFGFGPESNFIERAAWTGMIPLLFAGFAVVRRRRSGEVRFHLALALFGLSAALGMPPLPWIWRILPGYSEVNPTRLLLVWSFGVAVLAGLGEGLDEDGLPPTSVRVKNALWLAACVAGASYWFLLWRNYSELQPDEMTHATKVVALLIVEYAAAMWVLKPRRRSWAPWLAAVFCLIPALDVNPSAPAATYYPETPALAAMKDAAGEGRVFALGHALEPDLGMPSRLRDARGRDFTVPRRYERLVSGGARDFDFYSGAEEMPGNPALLGVGVLGATKRTAALAPKGWTLVHDGGLLVFRAPVPAKRALFVPEARAGSEEEAFAAVRAEGFAPSKTVWFDDGDAPSFPKKTKGVARIAEDGVNAVVVETEADGPGWLVLLDGWFPGWETAVNGKPARLRRADYAFRAVAVPAGKSVVRFDYRPRPLRTGLLLALAAALVLLAAAFL